MLMGYCLIKYYYMMDDLNYLSLSWKAFLLYLEECNSRFTDCFYVFQDSTVECCICQAESEISVNIAYKMASLFRDLRSCV